MVRNAVETYTGRMVIETCITCGCAFGVPEDFRRRKLDHHDENFWCPNGHSQHYVGESEADKLKRQLASSESNVRYYSGRVSELREEKMVEVRRHRSTQMQLGKVKKRIAHGVCPWCKRHFANVEQHVSTKHPNEGGAT